MQRRRQLRGCLCLSWAGHRAYAPPAARVTDHAAGTRGKLQDEDIARCSRRGGPVRLG